MPGFARLLVIAEIFFVLGTTGWASAQPLFLNVFATDEKDQPIVEAVIEVRLDGQIVAHAQTDIVGKATLEVPPGAAYLLTVRKTGYVTNESTLALRPQTGATDLDVKLTQISLSQQKITVQGSPSGPTSEESGHPSTLSPEVAKQTPSKPATLTEALPLIPGVVRANNGTLGIAGYGENHSTLLVNSVDVTDPATGDFGLSVPIDSVETISVSEMPYLAQYGRFIAGVVAAETRRGGEKWEYSVNDPLPEFRIRSGHLVGLKTASPRLNISGPLIRNRLYLSQGAEYLLYKQSVRTLPFPVNQTESLAINSYSQVDAILSSRQTLAASFHFAPHSLRYAGLSSFNPQPVTPNADFHESTGTIIHRMSVGSGLLQSTLATTSVASDVQSQGPANMVLSPEGNQGNYFGKQSRNATRLGWLENWTPRTLHSGGEHRLQIGSMLTYSEDDGRFHARPVEIQNTTGHTIQRIDFTSEKAFGLSDYAPAIYIQDHWILSSHFALDAGVRLEGQTITNTQRTAPRAGIVWTPDRNAKTVIRGGVGIFYDSVPLSTYRFSSYPEQIITSYDASGAVIGTPLHYINITEQATHSSFPFVDRSEKIGNFAPYSFAWNLEVERYINTVLTVRVKYLQSRAQGLITLQPQLVEGQNTFVLGSSGSAQTRQYEITAKIGANTQRQFFFSYVRQWARGNFSDGSAYLGNYPSPVIRQPLFASLPNEIPNRFLFWGTYALPKKIQLNPHIEFRNGFPFQPTNLFQQYVSLIGNTQPRFPRYFAFDLLVSKDFQITKKHAIRISVPLLNITNHFNPLEVHSNIADPNYGRFFGNYPRRILVDFDVLN